jgi:hypothetical protein
MVLEASIFWLQNEKGEKIWVAVIVTTRVIISSEQTRQQREMLAFGMKRAAPQNQARRGVFGVARGEHF